MWRPTNNDIRERVEKIVKLFLKFLKNNFCQTNTISFHISKFWNSQTNRICTKVISASLFLFLFAGKKCYLLNNGMYLADCYCSFSVCVPSWHCVNARAICVQSHHSKVLESVLPKVYCLPTSILIPQIEDTFTRRIQLC